MSTARVARSVKLDPEIDARLTALAQRTGRTKSFYMNRAIESALEEIELAKREMNDAYNHFQSASDPDLIDCYIYEQNAVMKRYRYLLQQAAGLSAVRLSPEELASEDPALEELPSGEFSSAKPVSAKQTAVG